MTKDEDGLRVQMWKDHQGRMVLFLSAVFLPYRVWSRICLTMCIFAYVHKLIFKELEEHYPSIVQWEESKGRLFVSGASMLFKCSAVRMHSSHLLTPWWYNCGSVDRVSIFECATYTRAHVLKGLLWPLLVKPRLSLCQHCSARAPLPCSKGYENPETSLGGWSHGAGGFGFPKVST